MSKLKAVPKLYCTKNYRMFVKDPVNRDVNLPKHKPLIASMTERGFLPSCPIAVFKNEAGDLVVKRGQNRLAIAESLGLPVYYVIDETEFDAVDLEDSESIPWSHRDRADNHARHGKKEYVELLEYVDKTGFPVALSASILMGTVTFGNISKQFKSGEFRVKDRQYAELVAELYLTFNTFDKKMIGTHLILALAAAARIPDFDKKRLTGNIKNCPAMLRKYSNRDDFLQMLEEIYNFRKRDLVPLKLNAISAMRARNAVMGDRT